MDTTTRPAVHVATLRCLRCARAEEMTSTDDPTMSGMVQIGTNIYYCARCAKIVGYT
jgi:DNA-directed RNA polymerase subunit RPC12/RpoP